MAQISITPTDTRGLYLRVSTREGGRWFYVGPLNDGEAAIPRKSVPRQRALVRRDNG